MAKKKTPAPNGAKTNNGASSKSTAKSNGRQTAPPKPAAGKSAAAAAIASPEISTERIGHVAGQIWHELAHSDGQSLATLKKSVDAPADLVVAALGWLAREGKLHFATSGRTLKISLR